MSVLIKGMEMPTRCEKCDLAYDDDGYFVCPFTKASYKSKQRPSWCPLVEVPLLTTSMPQLNISSPIFDPEWQKEHKAMGFWSPLADLYEELGIIEAEEEEHGRD